MIISIVPPPWPATCGTVIDIRPTWFAYSKAPAPVMSNAPVVPPLDLTSMAICELPAPVVFAAESAISWNGFPELCYGG